MITKTEAMQLFLRAAPAFQEQWGRYLACWGDTTGRSLYADFTEFARFMIEEYKHSEIKQLREIFDVIEKLNVEGDEYVKEAVRIGMLEDLQTISANEGLDPNVFVEFLGPQSRQWWGKINDFWATRN
jgi:hypothetical protein